MMYIDIYLTYNCGSKDNITKYSRTTCYENIKSML
jgi:hypothetical protein